MARMLYLVTGCAGFIGFHVTQYLLDRGERVIGVDDLNAYYDVALKQARLAQLQGRARFEFHQIDVADPTAMTGLAGRHSDIDAIIHLAAQAGVRYSLTQPLAYVEANVKGQVVLLETARKLAKLTSLVYASSSSVYGASTKQPFSADEPAIVTAAETAPAAPGEHRLYNLGNNHPEALLDFIAVIEGALGRKAIKEMLPMQLGDVATTYADIGPARRDLGFEPRTPIAVGLPRFVAWYREYHGLNKASATATP